MITLIIISSLLLLLVFGILFVPIRIVVNTNNKEYFISLPGYLRADLFFDKAKSFRIRLRMFFFTFIIEPAKRQKKTKDPEKKQRSRKIKNPLLLMKNILKSLRIKYCNANIDTGDFPLNAQLIPIAQTIQRENINLSINFKNENDLNLMIQTRGIKLIIVYVKHIMYNK